MRLSLILLALPFLFSCANDKPADAGTAATDSTAQKVFNPKAHEDSVRANNPVLNKSNNMMSPFKFVTTTPEYSKFGAFVLNSSYLKDLHNQDWVLLAPTNQSLSTYEVSVLGTLRMPENKKLLDEFISRHIIKAPFSIYKMTNLTEVETITGKKIPVDEKTLTIDGKRYSGVEFNTDIGNVISMDEPIALPFDKLEKLLKSQKGKK